MPQRPHWLLWRKRAWLIDERIVEVVPHEEVSGVHASLQIKKCARMLLDIYTEIRKNLINLFGIPVFNYGHDVEEAPQIDGIVVSGKAKQVANDMSVEVSGVLPQLPGNR